MNIYLNIIQCLEITSGWKIGFMAEAARDVSANVLL